MVVSKFLKCSLNLPQTQSGQFEGNDFNRLRRGLPNLIELNEKEPMRCEYRTSLPKKFTKQGEAYIICLICTTIPVLIQRP